MTETASFTVFTVRLCGGKELRSQRGNLVAGLGVSSVALWAGAAESTLELAGPLRRGHGWSHPSIVSSCALHRASLNFPGDRFTAAKGVATH